MNTPTPSAHSGEQGKPSDRAIKYLRDFLTHLDPEKDEAAYNGIEDTIRNLDTAHPNYRSALIQRMMNRMNEALDACRCRAYTSDNWPGTFTLASAAADELERKHEQSEPCPDCYADTTYAGGIDNTEQHYCAKHAPPPSEQAGISDEVIEIAEGKFDSVYEAQYFLDGTTDNKRAALAEVLKWYESALGGCSRRAVIEQIASLREHADESDSSNYGTLSTQLVRDHCDKIAAELTRPNPVTEELKQWRWVHDSVVQWRDGEPHEHEREWSHERGIPIETRTLYLQSAFPRGVDRDAHLEATARAATPEENEAVRAAIAHPAPEAQAEGEPALYAAADWQDELRIDGCVIVGPASESFVVPLYPRPQPSASETPSADARDARDAERYRWLQENAHAGFMQSGRSWAVLSSSTEFRTWNDCDLAIDAAIAAQRKEGE
jgi:hypothetical protein